MLPKKSYPYLNNTKVSYRIFEEVTISDDITFLKSGNNIAI